MRGNRAAPQTEAGCVETLISGSQRVRQIRSDLYPHIIWRRIDQLPCQEVDGDLARRIDNVHGTLARFRCPAGHQTRHATARIGELGVCFVDMIRMNPLATRHDAGELIPHHHRGKVQIVDHEIPDDRDIACTIVWRWRSGADGFDQQGCLFDRQHAHCPRDKPLLMPHLQDTAAGRGLISEITRSLAGQRQRFLDEHMAVRLNGLPRQLFMPDSRNRNDDCITRIQKCLVIVETLGAELIAAVATPNFRPYLAHDLLGAEIGGAVKNVLAIACGIALGKGLGRSAHAALIARGSAEMTRLALALGAERETLSGLSGLGDLVLTCSSETSRNMSCGLALGKGEPLEDIMGARNAVTEGVATAPVLKRIAADRGVDMPICDAVADVIEGAISAG